MNMLDYIELHRKEYEEFWARFWRFALEKLEKK